jgi:hypothetical protein
VFQCGKFTLDQSVIDAYLDPPVHTVEDVLSLSNTKQILSVQGVLKKVSKNVGGGSQILVPKRKKVIPCYTKTTTFKIITRIIVPQNIKTNFL